MFKEMPTPELSNEGDSALLALGGKKAMKSCFLASFIFR
jgi:hypothetical protein